MRTIPHAAGLLMAGLIGIGCSSTQEVRTYVRDARVEGPVAAPPVHVVTDHARNAATISFHVNKQGPDVLRGRFEGHGSTEWLYQLETSIRPDGTTAAVRSVPAYNLTWHRPGFAAGLDIDLAFQTMAVSGGVSVSGSSGNSQIGWHAGIGFFSGDTGTTRVRLDLGLCGQRLDYHARVAQVTVTSTNWLFGSSTRVDTAFFSDRDARSGIGYYASLTVNSARPSWPVNWFVQAHCVVQPVLSYTPYSRTTIDFLPLFLIPVGETTSVEVSTRATFLGVTPGIYIEPSPSMVILAGVRYMADVSDTMSDPGHILMPFLQIGLRAGR